MVVEDEMGIRDRQHQRAGGCVSLTRSRTPGLTNAEELPFSSGWIAGTHLLPVKPPGEEIASAKLHSVAAPFSPSQATMRPCIRTSVLETDGLKY